MSKKEVSNKATNINSEPINILSEEQRKEILHGLEQIKRGEVISNDDLIKEEDEWLAEE